MGSHTIKVEGGNLLHFRVEGNFSEAEMQRFVAEHNAAVDGFGSDPYYVFGDIRRLRPLSPASAALFEQAKRHSASHRNFRGSAILVENAVVALQHRRTSITSGVMPTELISEDEEACRRHIEALRHAAKPSTR